MPATAEIAGPKSGRRVRGGRRGDALQHQLVAEGDELLARFDLREADVID